MQAVVDKYLPLLQNVELIPFHVHASSRSTDIASRLSLFAYGTNIFLRESFFPHCCCEQFIPYFFPVSYGAVVSSMSFRMLSLIR